MKIVHILNHVKNTGNGIVNVTIDLACTQAKEGHTVVVASKGGDFETLLASYGVRHIAIDQTRRPVTLMKAAGLFRRMLHEFQPDIIHAHMMTGVVLAWGMRRFASKPYHIVSTVHNEFQKSAIFMGLADRVIGVSAAVSEAMQRRGVPAQRLRVVINGTIGSPRKQPLHEYQPLPLQHPAIVVVAGMNKRKGIADTITAFNEIAEEYAAHLYLVGNGPDIQEFKAQAADSAAAERIHFEGFQSEAQRYLLSADIFTLVSYKDPCCLAFVEAREAGCAIIGSNVDGTPELLDFGQAGILVPAGAPRELAKQLQRLLASPEELAVWRARSSAGTERFRVERVTSEVQGIYNELVRSPI